MAGGILIGIDEPEQVLEVVLRLDVRGVDLDRAVEVLECLWSETRRVERIAQRLVVAQQPLEIREPGPARS